MSKEAVREPGQAHVVFDGTCGLCSRFVVFVIDHDQSRLLTFVPRVSRYGQELLARHHLDSPEFDSIVLIERDRVFVRSDAVLAIAKRLSRPYSWLVLARVIPRPVRDIAYRCVAAIRHSLYKRGGACEMLPAQYRARIIEEATQVACDETVRYGE
jgi:predicted DCC family thiol-disulfide oxidoreductase YuxK